MNDKLTLNEHERITQIYTVRNANKKRVKKACEMWQNTLTYRAKHDTNKKNKIATTLSNHTRLTVARSLSTTHSQNMELR